MLLNVAGTDFALIVIVRLPQGSLGKENSGLVGQFGYFILIYTEFCIH